MSNEYADWKKDRDYDISQIDYYSFCEDLFNITSSIDEEDFDTLDIVEKFFMIHVALDDALCGHVDTSLSNYRENPLNNNILEDKIEITED
jgi:hypothetical protein